MLGVREDKHDHVGALVFRLAGSLPLRQVRSIRSDSSEQIDRTTGDHDRLSHRTSKEWYVQHRSLGVHQGDRDGEETLASQTCARDKLHRQLGCLGS
jgi:hypothetical protein